MADNSKIRWGWSSASLIALGMALGLGGVSQAYAQDETADEEIVITGRKVLSFKASQVLKKTMNGETPSEADRAAEE